MPKVTAKIIFKLPFSLNMEEVGNSSPQSLKKTRSEEIIIYPPVYAPHLAHRKLWQLKTKKPRKTELNKLNCIVIDIRRYFPTIPITDADQKALVTKAKETLYELLTLLRWRGKQLHISVIDVEHFDFRLRLFDTNGNIIDATGMMHLTLPSLPLKSSDWKWYLPRLNLQEYARALSNHTFRCPQCSLSRTTPGCFRCGNSMRSIY